MDASTSALPSGLPVQQRLLGLLPDALLLLAADGAISEVNPPACTLLGRERQALLGTKIHSWVASPAEAFQRYLGTAWRSGTRIPGAADLVTAEGRVRCRMSAGVLCPLGSGVPALIVCLQAHRPSPFAALTEKVDALRSEIAQRRQAEARLQSTVDGLPVAVSVRDEPGRFVLTNTTFRRWFGPVRAEPTGLFPGQALSAEAAAVVESAEPESVERSLGTGEEARHLLVQRFDAGTRGPEQLQGWVWIDITPQRRAEIEREKMHASVLHAQKLESLGVLAGGIAHDFNNLLVAILGNAELAVAQVDAASPAAECLREVSTAGQHAAELCRQLLAYSGKGRFVIRAVDINAEVREMGTLLDVSIRKNAVLEWNLGVQVASVKVDVTQFRQIVMNLITNASDAIGEDSGSITIATGTTLCSAEYLASMDVPAGAPPGLYTWLEVSDTGAGMDAHTRSRIFDPFFTTKFTGRGLGLAAVLGIVRGHKAGLRVASEVGRGTTFTVFFPVSGSFREQATRKASPSHNWVCDGTVLVVDDEPGVRNLARRILEDVGFDVLVAADGEEALRMARERADVRLVLLDMTMPRMSGEETWRRLREIRPDLRVVLSSGYDEQDAAGRFVGEGVTGFLPKPYSPDEFIQTVRRALES